MNTWTKNKEICSILGGGKKISQQTQKAMGMGGDGLLKGSEGKAFLRR